MKLTEVQRRGLAELASACDEAVKFYPMSAGWTRTGLLSGTRAERSAKNLRSLMDLGLVEGRKPNGGQQTQWCWLITPAGRSALDLEGRGDGKEAPR